MSDDERARIRLLAAEGLSVRAIARELGVSKSAVHRVLTEPEPDDYEPAPSYDGDSDPWTDPDGDYDDSDPDGPELVEPMTYCGEEWQILPQGRGEEPRRVRVERWTDARDRLCNELTFYRHRQALTKQGIASGVDDYDRDARAFDARLDQQRAEYARRSIANRSRQRR